MDLDHGLHNDGVMAPTAENPKFRSEIQEAVAGLDRAFPEGWRSDSGSDVLMVLMARVTQQIGGALFGKTRQ